MKGTAESITQFRLAILKKYGKRYRGLKQEIDIALQEQAEKLLREGYVMVSPSDALVHFRNKYEPERGYDDPVLYLRLLEEINKLKRKEMGS